jgi:hypothetical protein
MVVNATPLDSPVRVETHAASCVESSTFRYGPEINAWIRSARAAGIEAYDGLGLLVFQARRSLALWLSRPVEVDALAREPWGGRADSPCRPRRTIDRSPRRGALGRRRSLRAADALALVRP